MFGLYVWFVCLKMPVQIIGKPQPATPSQPATPGTALECQQYRESNNRAHKRPNAGLVAASDAMYRKCQKTIISTIAFYI